MGVGYFEKCLQDNNPNLIFFWCILTKLHNKQICIMFSILYQYYCFWYLADISGGRQLVFFIPGGFVFLGPILLHGLTDMPMSCSKIWCPSETHLKPNSPGTSWPITCIYFSNRFEILYGSRQYHGRSMSNILWANPRPVFLLIEAEWLRLTNWRQVMI